MTSSHMGFEVTWSDKKAFGRVAYTTGMKAEGIQVFGGDEMEAVVFMGVAEVNPKGGGVVGVTLPSCWTGPRAEGAFYGWFTEDQPWITDSRLTGS